MAWWTWVVAGFVLLALEMVSPGGFYVFFFGCAALVVGLLAALGWAQPLWLQGVLFAGLSVAAVVFFRPLIARQLRSDASEAVDDLVGERAVACDEIAANGFGRAELRGTKWNARNVGETAVGAGQACAVERVDGLTLWIRAE